MPRGAPSASSPDVLRRMKAQRRDSTRPEMDLRSALHRMGYRFRVNICPVEGLRTRADLVFSKPKIAVFVDGCFWHSCPIHGTIPKSNADWWIDKLAANVQRDQRIRAVLKRAGWHVVRVWEHEDSVVAARKVVSHIKRRNHIREFRPVLSTGQQRRWLSSPSTKD